MRHDLSPFFIRNIFLIYTVEVRARVAVAWMKWREIAQILVN